MLPSSAASEVETKFNPAPEIPWDHIAFGPPGDWVDLPLYDRSLCAIDSAHLTFLLWERQVNVEEFTSFHATAKRLETSVAVQHESQWQLNLDPRNHRLTIHWLRIVRGEQRLDALDRSRMRLIQRETQLEHLIIDGQWTLLLVLDDVRPGDVIEAAYSYVGRHPIRPDGTEAFFVIPPQIAIGRYRLRAEFSSARPSMAWKGSPDIPPPKEEPLPENRRRWTWEGQQTTLREPEPNQPSSAMDYSWIQFSDLTEWQPLATRLSEAWCQEGDTTGLDLIPAFARPADVNEQSVQGLIQHIQDEFRYLSIDLESGGWIPASPAKVAHRRYGDCKDLAWLTTNVLRTWGVSARPILVGTGLREKITALRPMTQLFNHAIVEVSIEGQTRWFDLTLKQQGGSFLTQCIGTFGFGLPIDPQAQQLIAQPGSPSRSLYILRETVLLDTRRDELSRVELLLRVEGWHADNLRRARSAQGPEEFLKERLQNIQRRYPKAMRSGEALWRDTRDGNVCELVETIDVRDATYLDERAERALFDVPPNIVAQSFLVPEEKLRRSPWDMPEPMEIRHQINVKASSMGSGPRNRLSWVQPEFTASLDEPRTSGLWTKTIRFSVHQSEISAERLPVYRRDLDDFLQASSWRLYLPRGQARPARDSAFGKLPTVQEDAAAYVSAADLSQFKDAPRNAVALAQLGTPAVTHRRTNWMRTADDSFNYWRIVVPVLILLSFMARNCSSTGP
jgi:transglutaminase-like putative cysteine protease